MPPPPFLFAQNNPTWKGLTDPFTSGTFIFIRDLQKLLTKTGLLASKLVELLFGIRFYAKTL